MHRNECETELLRIGGEGSDAPTSIASLVGFLTDIGVWVSQATLQRHPRPCMGAFSASPSPFSTWSVL